MPWGFCPWGFYPWGFGPASDLDKIWYSEVK